MKRIVVLFELNNEGLELGAALEHPCKLSSQTDSGGNQLGLGFEVLCELFPSPVLLFGFADVLGQGSDIESRKVRTWTYHRVCQFEIDIHTIVSE